jgi:uncharacterized protein (DUF362 family)
MNERRSDSSRRDFLRRGAVGAAAVLAGAGRSVTVADDQKVEKPAGLPPLRIDDRSAKAPTSPVVIERATKFDKPVLAELLKRSFDRLGGIRKLVSGKTVTVKLNVTGDGRKRLGGKTAARSYQVHPNLIEVLCGALHQNGAKRICLVESYYRRKDPREILASHKWDVAKIESAGGHTVVWEDTRNRGQFKDYVKLDVPWGGYTFPSYHLNRRYVDTDVMVSIAKIKNHITAGVTGAVKNLFGITPTALYGNDAPNENTIANRGNVLHQGSQLVPEGVTQEHDSDRPRLAGGAQESYYRVPMVTADLLGIRPVDLAVVEGIETCRGGEGPWCRGVRPIDPGLVLVGRNAITVDAIMTAVMGYDPTASTNKDVWPGYNHLELLARAGVATNDPARIEVLGTPLEDALHDFFPDLKGWVKRNLVK